MKYAKFCPKCKSFDVKISWKSFWFFGFPPTFVCNKCGFKSILFPEMSIERVESKKTKLNKNKK